MTPRKILTNYLRFGFGDCFICGFADELIRRQERYIGLCGKCIFASIIDPDVQITTDFFGSTFSLLSWSPLVVPNVCVMGLCDGFSPETQEKVGMVVTLKNMLEADCWRSFT